MRQRLNLKRRRKSLIRALLSVAALFWGMTGCATIKESLNYSRALEEFKKNRYDSSEEYLQAALRTNPSDEKAISLLGWIRLREGRTAEAEELFTKAEKLNPENPGTIEGLGWIYYSQGEDGRAEEKFQKLAGYAQKHLQNSDWRDYSSEDQEFIQSIDSDANYALGLIARRRGLWPQARAYFERALNQLNRFVLRETISRDLADAYFETREYKLAAEQYKNLLSHNPRDPFLLGEYAFCLYQTGNLGEARDYYEQAEKLNSAVAKFYSEFKGNQTISQKLSAKRIAEPYYGLALVYARERKFEAARKELAMGMKISPFSRHPDEIVRLFREHPDWQELLN